MQENLPIYINLQYTCRAGSNSQRGCCLIVCCTFDWEKKVRECKNLDLEMPSMQSI